MRLVIVVAIQHWIVYQLYLLLFVLVPFGYLLLSMLLLADRGRVGSLDFTHELPHQLLPETIQRTPAHIFDFLACSKPVKFINDFLLNIHHVRLLLFLLVGIRIDRVSFHLNIFLNLILVLLLLYLLVEVVVNLRVLKELAIGERCKLLTQFYVF